jgi:hypothetical protein
MAPTSASPSASPTITGTLSLNKASLAYNEDLVATYTLASPVGGEWVGVYLAGACGPVDCPADLGSLLLWLYPCGNQNCTTTRTSGTLTFGAGIPDEANQPETEWPLPGGSYEMVLLGNGSEPFPIIDSVSFTVEPAGTLSLDKATYSHDEGVLATFTLAAPSGEEWLAVYVVGMCTITTCPEGSTLWLYSCGDQSCSPSTSSGSTLTFGSGPPDEHNRPEDEWPLAAEGYEMVLLLATGSAPPYQIIASVGFTVDPPVTTAITDANRDTCCRASNMGTTGPLPLNRVLSNPTVR